MALQHAGTEASDRDERLGEAIEAYLELAEAGRAPEPDAFVQSYPDLADELREALDGLALVQGLVGSGTGPGGVGSSRLAAGYRVAGYRIVRELGRGGMGVVYEAVHVDLDRPVALKILGGHAAPGSSGRRRFLNEAKTAAGLHHTHIVPVFDVGQVGGLCYYAMQRIEGSGLDRVLRVLRRDRMTASGSPSGRSPMPTDRNESTAARDDSVGSGLLSLPSQTAGGDTPGSWSRRVRLAADPSRIDDRPPAFVPPTGSEYYRWVARVGKQAAEALAYAHRRGIIHRDVKPSNLLVDARGIVWVADFGLARRLEDPGQTRGDGPVGTPRYMSPEQADGRPIGPATDVYSLGATLYELLTLRPPFDGQTSAELVRQIVDRDPPPLRRFARRLPRDLETIVLKAMSKRPGDRYESAAELADDLGRFLNFEPVEARRISPIGRTWRLVQRHPTASIITTIAAAAILITATVAYVRVANERDRALVFQRELAAALEKQRDATRAEQVARAGELLSQLPVLRASTMPRRRDEGRAKLREAAALAPEESMRVALRDEALELLAARDVEDRPSLATGRVRGLVSLVESEDDTPHHLAVLSEDGETLTLWDPNDRIALLTIPLRLPRVRAEAEGDEESRPSGSPRRGAWGPHLAVVGPSIAVLNPEGTGILLVDPDSGSVRPLDLDGAEVLGLLAPRQGHRLVTIEAIPRPPAEGSENGEASDDDSGRSGRGSRVSTVGLRVRLWDIDASPAPLATLDEITFEPGFRIPPWPLVEFDPEGKTVVVGRTAPETRLVIFDADDGGRLSGFDTGIGLTALTVGPGGLIAAAGDGRVQLWEVDPWSGSPAVPLPGLSEGFVRMLRFSPSGRLLVTAGRTTGVEIWDPAANAPVASIPTATWVQDVAFADGRTLLVASGPTTEVWSIVEPIGRVGFEIPTDEPTRLPSFGPDGLMLLPLHHDAPRVWHPDHCPTRARPWEREEGQSAALAFDPEGRVLAFGPEGLARFASPDASEPIDGTPWPPQTDATAPTSGLRLMAQSADGRTALVLREFDLRLEEASRRDRDGDRDGSGSGRSRGSWRPPFEFWLWRADDRGGPGTLNRLELSGRGDRAQPSVPREPFQPTTVLSPDGLTLYFLDRGDLHAWAIDGEGNRPKPIALPEFELCRSLALSPDGRLLVLGGEAGDARLITTDSWTVVAEFPSPDPSATRWTLSVAFSPDGRLLAIGDGGGVLNLWELGDLRNPSPRRLLRLPRRRDPILGLTFSPDGRHLASLDFRSPEDRVVEVWDLHALRSELAALHLDW
ncbi:WD40 repeat domain-containing serine/threonine protein kinase [Tautonia rosea]|uniref:WD40 repeat domain-containing serine/threonine protein kinase n=1 Tax=Tautonia rosea TaxID=2728037 RepID=UPI0014726CD4|nr:serine/threonine-protein kinase [Tautonia rosea]